MSETFFVADLHLGHSKVIEYTNRPFNDVDEMDKQLIKNWNKVVNKKDSIYILGDFSFAGIQETEEILCTLKGTKYLLLGNHDKISSKNKKYFTWIKDYFELKENKQLWVLCHYPLYSWNKRHHGAIHLHGHTHQNVLLDGGAPKKCPLCDNNLKYCLSEAKDAFYYSCSKCNCMDCSNEIYNRFMCVSAECINYTPISLTEIRNKFEI